MVTPFLPMIDVVGDVAIFCSGGPQIDTRVGVI